MNALMEVEDGCNGGEQFADIELSKITIDQPSVDNVSQHVDWYSV